MRALIRLDDAHAKSLTHAPSVTSSSLAAWPMAASVMQSFRCDDHFTLHLTTIIFTHLTFAGLVPTPERLSER